MVKSRVDIGHQELIERISAPIILHSRKKDIERGSNGTISGNDIIKIGGASEVETELIQTLIHVVVRVEKRIQKADFTSNQKLLPHVARCLAKHLTRNHRQYDYQPPHPFSFGLRFICQNES